MTKKIRSTFMYCTKRIVKAFYTFSLLACILLNTQCQRTSKSGQTNEGLDKATTFAYYPSLRNLEIRIGELGPEIMTGPQKVIARVRLQGKNKTVARQKFLVSEKGGNYFMKLPALKDGTYELTVSMNGGAAEVKKIFKHKNFPWLGNDLGKKDMIYPPFEPIKVNDNVAQVVLRDYQMNGFGLWNSVKSQGKEILAAPIALHLTTDKGEVSWRFAEGKWSSIKDIEVVYKADAESAPVRVKSTSTIEYDGCMKVEMELLPGKSGETIQHLWLEIPMKDSEVPLFHYTAFESMRRNYAGKTPRGGKITWVNEPYDSDPPRWPQGAYPPYWKAEQGSDDGILWTCRDIRPWKHVISTDFVPYIWLGGGERGLAFIGANDKGYLVDRQSTMQNIERRGNIVYLRIDIVNKPSVIKEPRHITFGLQASPTRPMEDNWRVKQRIYPAMPGPVLCWGSYLCANKYPEGYHWQIVDEINKVRETGIIDSAIFKKLDLNRAEPWKKPWGGTGSPGFDTWLARDTWSFINRAKGYHDNSDWRKIAEKGIFSEANAKVLANPAWIVYAEEHASDVTEPEWEVFQDEWRAEWPWIKPRNEIKGQQQPVNNFKYGNQAYTDSYLDFCLFYHNEWFRRGIGVYFDNTFPYSMYNPLLSEAYFDENGKLQPACSIWEQREYYKRTWLRMNEVEKMGVPHPLVFAQHITNTRLLPWNTWCTTNLDIEWSWFRDTTNLVQQREVPERRGTGTGRNSRPRFTYPMPADLLLAESAGRQTGTMSDSHFNVLGQVNFNSKVVPETYELSEWGMRAVNEFKFRVYGKMTDILWKFGYGTDRTKVVNYWADDPPVIINDPDKNKWLLVIRKSDNSLFLVLQTWNKPDSEVNVTLDPALLGFTPASKARDVVTGMEIPFNGLNLKLKLPGPYGTRIITLGAKEDTL